MPSGRSLAHTKLRPQDAREICHIMDESGLAAMVMQDAFHADIEWLISAELEMPPTVPEWFAHHNSSFRRVGGLRSAAHEWTIRVSTIASHDASATLFDRLSRELIDRVYLHQITIPTSGARVLEVFDRTVNKWTGVKQIAGMHNVPEANIIAVGDDMNDLHMLEHAALGVAMGNANEHVKRIADGEIASHAEDGLAVFLEELLAGDALLTSARRAVRKA
jgi:hydroxymethylpyrimidine pyrophosphatase-like HAD family hydrolase